MARKLKKSQDVAKFGGVEELGNVNLHGHSHEASTIEFKSNTHLEQDQGHGDAAIVRCFTFGMNVASFKEAQPSKQEIFNSHLKGIETKLWMDGMKIIPEVQPRLVFNTEKAQYQIFVGARPMKGHILHERPQTLSEIARS